MLTEADALFLNECEDLLHSSLHVSFAVDSSSDAPHDESDDSFALQHFAPSE